MAHNQSKIVEDRIPLEKCFIADNVFIEETIGFGGSCIVYKGTINDRNVIIKEFFPKSLNVKRISSGKLIIADEDKNEFFYLQNDFLNGQKAHERYYEMLKDHVMPRAFQKINYNNTVYMISDPGVGYVLSEFHSRCTDKSIECIATIMSSICDAISLLHKQGVLYLDIKPDNFMYYQGDNKGQIYLFDFDTAIEKSKINDRNYEFCSYSIGWAAPEQTKIKDGRYINLNDITYSTDIYGVGSVFFYLLTERKPIVETIINKRSDYELIKDENFNWKDESSICKNASSEAIKCINDILFLLLQPNIKERKRNFDNQIAINSVKKMFEILSGYVTGDKSYQLPIYNLINELKNSTVNSIDNASQNTINSINSQLKEAEDSIRETIFAETKNLTGLISNIQHNLSQQQSNFSVHTEGTNESPKYRTTSKASSFVTLNKYGFESEKTELLGRNAELQYLLDMCETTDVLFCWTGIYGSAGTGKSRLAYELCKRMEKKGWWTVRPSRLSLNIDKINEQICNSTIPVLICCDDAKYQLEHLEELIYFICSYPEQIRAKVRLVLLDRTLDDIIWSSADIMECLFLHAKKDEYSFLDKNGIIELSGLGISSGKLVLKSYIKSMGKTIDEKELSNLFDRATQIDCLNRPIFLLVAADIWCDSKTSFSDKYQSINYLLSKENERILKVIKTELSKKSEISYYQDIIYLIRIVATFCGKIEFSKIEKLLTDKFHKRFNSDSLEWIINECGLLDEDKNILGVTPDILAEYMCVQKISQMTTDEVDTLYHVILSENGPYVVYYMSNMAKDYPMFIRGKKLCIIFFATVCFEVAVGENISVGLSDEILDEFNNITDDALAMEWLQNNSPNWREIINKSMTEIAETLLKRDTFIADEGKLKWPCGLEYSGTIFDGRAYGHGFLYPSEKSSNELEWLNYEGDFEEFSAKNGKLTLLNGKQIEGNWDSDNAFMCRDNQLQLESIEKEYSKLNKTDEKQIINEILLQKISLLRKITSQGYGFSKEIFSSLAELGDNLISIGKYEDALLAFNEGLRKMNIAKQVDWRSWRENLHYYFVANASFCLSKLCQYSAAKTILEDAISILPNKQNSLLLRTAEILIEEGNIEPAEITLSKIIASSKKEFESDTTIEKAKELLFDYYAFLNLMKKKGAWQAANDIYEKSGEVCNYIITNLQDRSERNNIRIQHAYNYMCLVNDEVEFGNANNGYEVQETIEDDLKNIKNCIEKHTDYSVNTREILADVTFEYGRYNLLIKAFSKSKSALEGALLMYRELSSICQVAYQLQVAKALRFCAELYKQTDNLKSAKNYCEEAIQILTPLKSLKTATYQEEYENAQKLHDEIMQM